MDLSEGIDIAFLPGSYSRKLFNFLIKIFVIYDKNTIYELIQKLTPTGLLTMTGRDHPTEKIYIYIFLYAAYPFPFSCFTVLN